MISTKVSFTSLTQYPIAVRVVVQLLTLSLLFVVTASYVERVHPYSYKTGDIVPLKVNSLTSSYDLFPLEYYHLPYCTPVDGVQLDRQNLGQYLLGDRIQNSPYLLKMKTDMYCEQLCVSNIGRSERTNKFRNAIVAYNNNWMVDNLPSLFKFKDHDDGTSHTYSGGFPVGFEDDSLTLKVHNHVNIEIEYHAVDHMTDVNRIVGFTVEPLSIAYDIEELVKHPEDFDVLSESYLPVKAKIKNPIPSCNPQMTAKVHTNYDMLIDNEVKPQAAWGEVLFTYDVIWKENPDFRWASRWDMYMSMNNSATRHQWIRILKILIIVIAMSAFVVSKLIAILRNSATIPGENYVPLANDEAVDEVGWMAVRSDVFRPPSFSPMLLAVGCGSGAQLLCTTIVTVWLAYLGYMKAPHRGYLVLYQFWFYLIFGCINGYVTARYYKAFGGKEQHRTTTIAAFGLPGIAFTIFMTIELIALLKQSSYALPFTTVCTLIVLWASISVPLVFLGAHWGYQQNVMEYPVSTSSIPREIPNQPCFLSSPIAVGISGIFPFYICFEHWETILFTLRIGIYYDIFGYGFLLIVFFLVSFMSAEQAVCFTYYQLSNEDYRWWWRAFWNGGSVGIYIFLYSWWTSPYFRDESYILYFGCIGLVSLAIFVMMGFVGVSSSLYFNKVLYTSIKTE